MKLSNNTMSEYLIALNSISEKVSGKIAYAVARNIRKISNEGVEYDMLRNKIIEKYGTMSEDGFISVSVDSPDFEKAKKEIDEIGNIEHDVDIFMITQEDIYTSQLSVKDILSIDFMIEEPTE